MINLFGQGFGQSFSSGSASAFKDPSHARLKSMSHLKIMFKEKVFYFFVGKVNCNSYSSGSKRIHNFM